MRCGVAMFLTEGAMRPGALARAVEERGFESLWFTEHSHIPASRETPWPGGGELPREYCGLLDPFVSLAFAAEATRSLKLGTGVCLVVQRDPIQTAKEVATLDVLSGGRFLFGVGGGWNREEMRNHGTAFAARWKVLRERIEAMKEIWTRSEASYAGETLSERYLTVNARIHVLELEAVGLALGAFGLRELDRVTRRSASAPRPGGRSRGPPR